MPADLTEDDLRGCARAAPAATSTAGASASWASTASNFREREQLALFGAEDPKRHQAAEAMDVIRRKYGERAVTRGRLVRAGVPTVFERDPNSAVEGRLGVPEEPTGRRRREQPQPEEPDEGIDPPAAEDP